MVLVLAAPQIWRVWRAWLGWYIADVPKSDKIDVEKSNVPVKNVAIEKRIKFCQILAEGTAIQDLFNPNWVLIEGREKSLSFEKMLFSPITWLKKITSFLVKNWDLELDSLLFNHNFPIVVIISWRYYVLLFLYSNSIMYGCYDLKNRDYLCFLFTKLSIFLKFYWILCDRWMYKYL